MKVLLRSITDNLVWKLLSLALAAALWMVLVNDPELTSSLTVPVEYKNLSSNLDISTDVPESVELQVRGPRSKLGELAASKPAVILDVARLNRPGERTFSIGNAEIGLPERVTLVRSVPAQLRLRVEARVAREIPVTVRFAGPPPEGFRARAEVSPATVRVVGPENRVRLIAAAETDPVDLGHGATEWQVRVPIFVSDPHVSLESSAMVGVKVLLEKTRR